MKGIAVKRAVEKKVKPFPVVGIGASAGGIEAVSDLLKSLPTDTGMCFIYIQHLDPTHESMLSVVLSRSTTMPLQEATEGVKLKPNHIYIIPPNREMSLEDGSLKLSVRPIRPGKHLPINKFFESLAHQYHEKAIGVLLSGNGPDGTLGLKAIKEVGGICFAQDNTALFGGMPKSAIAENAVDLVLPPNRIAEELAKLAEHQATYHAAIDNLIDENAHGAEENISGILKQVYRLTGVDFSQYKVNTIKRRIARRMILHKLDSVDKYAQLVKAHPNEANQLYQDLLINVTTFFRDAEATDYLRKTIIPKLVNAKAPNESIRVWVPACSTGQEAYSLAIMLFEALGDKAANTGVQIFATDLSEIAVNKARLGIYSKDEVAEISQKQLDRFFVKIDGSYRVIKSLRDVCIFATHNVLKDPPFSRLDIVSCCNLLIYMEPSLQKKMMATFHYSLNNLGYLVLGKSETIGTSASLFTQLDKKVKIYGKKKDLASKALFELSYNLGEREKPRIGSPSLVPKHTPDEIDLDKLVDQLLLKKYTPACVVVNHDMDIKQFRGATGLFLEPAPGRATLNLLKMARPELSFELRTIVHRTAKSGVAERKTVEVQIDDKQKKITLEAIPVPYEPAGAEKFFVVIFQEQDQPVPVTEVRSSKDTKVKRLEEELTTIREDMRTVLEEQEAANEELQSVNEEIVSSNEELQSINEELETSKEELESSNEELITINQELQMRNEQLVEIQEYAEAVFTTIRESLLILDKNLRVKTANTTFYQTFKLTEEETEGKFVYDLGSKEWNITRLKELLEDVIPRNSVVTDFEVVNTFKNIGEKIMVVNARRLVRKVHSEHLILLAIEDITSHRHAQKVIFEREEWFRNMANNSPMMVWVADTEKKLEFVNDSWLEYRNKSYEEAIGQSWIEQMHPEDEKRVKKVFDECFTARKAFTVQYRLKKGTGYRPILSKGKPNLDHTGVFTGFIGSCVEMPTEVIE
jgi:two-component system, chemotaxis family, CheB/CheR fusion protein